MTRKPWEYKLAGRTSKSSRAVLSFAAMPDSQPGGSGPAAARSSGSPRPKRSGGGHEREMLASTTAVHSAAVVAATAVVTRVDKTGVGFSGDGGNNDGGDDHRSRGKDGEGRRGGGGGGGAGAVTSGKVAPKAQQGLKGNGDSDTPPIKHAPPPPPPPLPPSQSAGASAPIPSEFRGTFRRIGGGKKPLPLVPPLNFAMVATGVSVPTHSIATWFLSIFFSFFPVVC